MDSVTTKRPLESGCLNPYCPHCNSKIAIGNKSVIQLLHDDGEFRQYHAEHFRVLGRLKISMRDVAYANEKIFKRPMVIEEAFFYAHTLLLARWHSEKKSDDKENSTDERLEEVNLCANEFNISIPVSTSNNWASILNEMTTQRVNTHKVDSAHHFVPQIDFNEWNNDGVLSLIRN